MTTTLENVKNEAHREEQAHKGHQGTLRASKAPVMNEDVWIPIGRSDKEGFHEVCKGLGLSDLGCLNVQSVLSGLVITSPTIYLADISAIVAAYNGDDPECPALLSGTVKIETSDGTPSNRGVARTRVSRGFTFLPDIEQKCLLAVLQTRTRLDKPDPVTGVSVGLNTVVYAIFPETYAGYVGANGKPAVDFAGKPLSYRPGFRLMIEHFNDRPKQPMNVWFNQEPKGDTSEFNLLLPELLYAAALEIGASPEELRVREESWVARQNNKILQSTGSAQSAWPSVEAPARTAEVPKSAPALRGFDQ